MTASAPRIYVKQRLSAEIIELGSPALAFVLRAFAPQLTALASACPASCTPSNATCASLLTPFGTGLPGGGRSVRGRRGRGVCGRRLRWPRGLLGLSIRYRQ